MSHPFLAKAIPIGSVILSGLVIFLCVAGILITWFMNFALGALVVDLSTGVEKTSQALQRAVTRMETGVTTLQTDVNSISDAANQISQNIADQGLIMTVLPDDKQARLSAAMEQVTDAFGAVNDALVSARDFYNAINRIPGVNLPQPSPDNAPRLSETVKQLQTDVQDVRDGVQRVRGGAANTVNQLAEAVDRVSERLGNLTDQLNMLNGELKTVEAGAQQFRRTVPTIITILAVILTLIQIWVIYTQYVIVRLYWGKWHTTEQLPAP